MNKIIYKDCRGFMHVLNKFIIKRTVTQLVNKINISVNNNVTLTTQKSVLKEQQKSVFYCLNSCKYYSNTPATSVDSATFEKACEETLESLCDYFEEIVENDSHLQAADVSYSSGVLTVNFGNPYGTYVINRQSPNHQIWLSSPVSGPKRYDFVQDGNYWIYKHDNITLHQLLQQEISKIIKNKVDFSTCSYSLL